MKRILWDAGFFRVQSDGELLAEMWEEEDFKQDIIMELSTKCSMENPDSEELIGTLVQRVASGTPSRLYQPYQMKWLLEDRRLDLNSKLRWEEDISIQIQKWRHWKPSRSRTTSSISMKDLEASLKEKWVARLMAHLLPVGAHFSNIKPLLECANVLVEAKHLLGNEVPNDKSPLP